LFQDHAQGDAHFGLRQAGANAGTWSRAKRHVAKLGDTFGGVGAGGKTQRVKTFRVTPEPCVAVHQERRKEQPRSFGDAFPAQLHVLLGVAFKRPAGGIQADAFAQHLRQDVKPVHVIMGSTRAVLGQVRQDF